MGPHARRFPAPADTLPGSVSAFGPPNCLDLALAGCVAVPQIRKAQPYPPSFEAPRCNSTGSVGCVRAPLGARDGVPEMQGDLVQPVQWTSLEGTNITIPVKKTYAVAWGDMDGDGDLVSLSRFRT